MITTEDNNDDLIIAKALIKIKEAVLSQDWQIVCDAYNSITDEELEVPAKPKSRKDKIKELMQQQSSSADEEETSENDDKPVKKADVLAKDMSVADLKESLLLMGFKDSDLKGKKKDELFKLSESGGPMATFQKGGKLFGRGKIQIISDPYNEEAAELNKKIDAKTLKLPKNRTSVVIKDNSNDENAQIRFYNTPPKPQGK